MTNNQIHEDQSPNFATQKQALSIIILTMLITFLAGLIAIELGVSKAQLLLIEIFTIIPALIFVLKKKLSAVQIFRLRPVNRNIIFVSILLGLALTIIADEVDRIVQIFFPMPKIILESIEKTLVISSISDFFIITFSAVVLAAVCEELLFRGFLQTSFEHTFDITKAVMLTALIFAIVHFNPWWTIQLMLFGIFLGVLSWKSDSIIPSVIVHVVNNAVALVFINLDESYFQWYLWKNHIDPFLLVLAGLITIFGFKRFYKYCDGNNE